MASQNYRNTVQEWDEKLEQCPYYPSHQIRPARFGHHLIQCRKALSKQPTSPYYHKIDDLVVCKFNSHHHIPRERMGDHIKKCQGIVTVLKMPMNRGPEPFNKADDGISNIMTGVERINTHADDDDDWDDDYTPAYDPSAKAAQLPMHLPAGLTPAERRNYRINKRHDVYEDFEGSELPVGASGQNQSPVQSSWAEPPRASYPPPSPKVEPSRTSYYPPSPKVEPPRASYSPPSQKRTDTNAEPNESWANAAGKKKNKKKKKPKVLEAKENNNDDDDWEVLPASYKKDEDWDQVPVSNKKGGQNPGKNNVSRGGQHGGGSDRGAPPGFGNKFAGLSAEVPKKGGRNRGGKMF